MEFIIDTVNLEDIKEAVEYMPIVGVTSNPSIVKKTSPKDFFQHMKEVRKIIGKERSLHIQVISKECDEIVKEAHRIIEEIDDQVYIKVPVSYEGVKAIKQLKSEGVNVTATAVYDLMQAYMALAAGADYIAPAPAARAAKMPLHPAAETATNSAVLFPAARQLLPLAHHRAKALRQTADYRTALPAAQGHPARADTDSFLPEFESRPHNR